MSSNFAAEYARLNAQQRKAVDTLEGPVMVIAGPGTGKTQVLAMRIGQLLKKTDIEPRNILALTFTDAAATTMRHRLATHIGSAAYSVQIATFHSFCSQVIADHPESFPFERDSLPLTELERYELIGEILTTEPLEELRPLNRPLFYSKDCLRAISQLKREYVSPDALRSMVVADLDLLEQGIPKATVAQRRIIEKRLKKQEELAHVFSKYEERLRSAHKIDFDDMISFVVTGFKNDPMLLQEYQELIHYILVDEYQDTNSAQNEIVSLLGSYWGEQANVFVVGDPHQSIFRFQGASMENMFRFAVQYPTAAVVTLTDGYRCGQHMYSAAHALVAAQDLPMPFELQPGVAQVLTDSLSTQLRSQAANPGMVRSVQLPTSTAEQLYIGEQIQQLHSDGVPLSQIAVLYRTNAEGLELENVLGSLGVRYQIERGSNALEVPLITQILSLISMLFHLRSAQDSEAFTVMCFDWIAVDRLAVYKLTRQAAIAGRSLVSLAELSWDEFQLQQAQVDVAEHLSEAEHSSVHSLVEQWIRWITTEPSIPFSHWFSLVLEQTSLIDWIVARPQSQELLNAVQGIFSLIQDSVANDHSFNLGDFIAMIDTMQEHGIAVRQEDVRTTAEAVTLSTAHSAKGKQWQHVFIYNCIDSHWGGSRSVDKLPLPEHILKYSAVADKLAQAEADDRRLLYVAMTRARKTLTITYPAFVVSQGKQKPQLPSRFLSPLEDYIQCVSNKDVTEFGEAAEATIPKLLLPNPAMSTAESIEAERSFFSYLVSTFSLSVSALNHYLADPKQFRDQDLLRVPSIKDAYFSYGSAMHKALELWQRPKLSGGLPASLPVVMQEFDRALAKEVLTADEFTRRQKKGHQVLSEYLSHEEGALSHVFSIERRFGSLRSPVYLDDIPLKGRIDRMDWIDQQASLVRVVDYKTGKPKTVGQIMATVESVELSERERSLPETIRGPMIRQLVFYKLLANLDPSFQGTVTHGRFIFVEPNKSTRTPFVVREFEITDQAVADLSALIKTIMTEVRQLVFLDKAS